MARRLFVAREREDEFRRREAAGEDVWVRDLPQPARRRIKAEIEHVTSRWAVGAWNRLRYAAIGLIQREGLQTSGQILQELQTAGLTEAFTILEALFAAPDEPGAGISRASVEPMMEATARVLREQRVAFDLVEGMFVDRRSQELHEEVVGPSLRLLHRSGGWEAVDERYRSALELLGSNPGDAITNATTALEEALELAGAGKGPLGKQADRAVETDVLARRDRKLIDWASADRATSSTSHGGGQGDHSDAWLAVHVIGALILRLSEGPRGPRG